MGWGQVPMPLVIQSISAVTIAAMALSGSRFIVSAGGKCEAVGIAVGANEGRAKEVSANLVSDTANASATDADDAADNLRGAALGNRTPKGLVVVGRHVGSLLKGWFKARWSKIKSDIVDDDCLGSNLKL